MSASVERATSALLTPHCWAAEARQIAGRIDKANMRENLWKIAHEPASERVVLLGEQAHVVSQFQETLEKSPVARRSRGSRAAHRSRRKIPTIAGTLLTGNG